MSKKNTADFFKILQLQKLLLRLLVLILLLAAAALFTACSAKQILSVSADGKISGEISIKLSDVFMEYISDLSEAAGTGKEPASVFDIDQIKAAFAEIPEAHLKKITVPRKSELNLVFEITNIEGSLEQSGIASVIRYSSTGSTKKIVFNLDGKNYRDLSSVFSIEDNPVLAGLTPYPDNPYTEKEYIELLEYVFYDYPGGRNIGNIVKNSFVEIQITAAGTVTKAEGGSIRGNTAVFSIPVVKFLTLENPVFFSVEYR